MPLPLQYRHQYHDYDSTLHNAILVVIGAYIPFIIVPSIFVISAVTLLKKLHNPHNIILLAISVSDILVALVVIPVYMLLGIPTTQDFIFSNELLCRNFCVAPDIFEIIGLSHLTLLGVDVFIQITFPWKYRSHVSNKNTIVCVVIIYLVNFLMLAIILALRDPMCPSPNDEYTVTLAGRIHLLYLQTITGLLLIVCFVFGVYVRCRHWKQRKTATERITLWLMMAFIIFYSPTLSLLIFLPKLDNTTSAIWSDVAKTIRFLSPATNAIIIYFTRPVYKFAFRYFLKTNPKHWKRVEHQFRIEQSKSKMTTSTPAGFCTTSNVDNNFKAVSIKSTDTSLLALSLHKSQRSKSSKAASKKDSKKCPIEDKNVPHDHTDGDDPRRVEPSIEDVEPVPVRRRASNWSHFSSRPGNRRSTLHSLPSSSVVWLASILTKATKATQSDWSDRNTEGSSQESSRGSTKSRARLPEKPWTPSTITSLSSQDP